MEFEGFWRGGIGLKIELSHLNTELKKKKIYI